MKKITLLAVCFGIFLVPALTFAGYIFETQADMGKQKVKMVYSIEGDLKKIDVYQDKDLKTSMISDPNRPGRLMIMHDRKQYVHQTEEDAVQARKEMQNAMDQMKKKMSKKDRAKLEAMMSNDTGIAVSVKDFSIKPTEQTKKIGKYNTKLVQLYYKGELFQDNWMTTDIQPDAVAAMESFGKDTNLNPERSDLERSMKEVKASLDSYGVPVLTTIKYNEKTKDLYGESSQDKEMPNEVTVSMTRIEKKRFSDKTFKPPKRYTEMSVPALKK